MEETNTPWSRAAFFICSKCGTKMQKPALAETLKSEYKARMVELGRGAEIRVMVSGCLDECPENLQAAAYCPVDGPQEIWVFDPETERAGILKKLESK